MSSKPHGSHVSRSGHARRLCLGVFGVSLCFASNGCLSSLNRHGLAVAAATAPVIDQADAAYHGAQRLHDLKVDYAAVDLFEKTHGVDKAAITEFPSEQAIQVRMTVLEAFKCYVDTLVELTNGVSSPQLEAAAKSVGSSLTAVGNTLAPNLEDLLHLAPPTVTNTTTYTTNGVSTTTSATVATPLIAPSGQNATSTAVLALGQFLVNRKVKKELPAEIKKMDPVLQALCKVLEDDIDILQKQEQRDFDAIADSQTLFLQSPAGTKLDEQQRRTQIAMLPEIIRKQRQTEEQLARLRVSVEHLYLTHHAMAADARDNNPSSLKAKLGDLAAAGNDLGKFYSSLPTK